MSEVQARLSELLTQLQVLNGSLQSLYRTRSGVQPAIAKELLGELGGVLAEEAFGTASAGASAIALPRNGSARRKENRSIIDEPPWNTR